MHRAFCVALLIGTILLDAPGAPAGGTPEGTVARQFEVARHSPCERPHPSSIAYHYPIRPFRRQHPIRGFFGDPRTLAAGRFGADSSRSQGSFTFHNGIDIVAPVGARVYPVVGGVVEALYYHDEVSVSTSDGRVFQYYHIDPRVQLGQHVAAERSLLGRVRAGWLHVHLTEIDGFRAHNPLDPGHLEPYRDHTVPAIDRLEFRTADGRELDPQKLRRRVLIAADAEDRRTPRRHPYVRLPRRRPAHLRSLARRHPRRRHLRNGRSARSPSS